LKRTRVGSEPHTPAEPPDWTPPTDIRPRILVGHVLEQIRRIPSGVVQVAVTSPPYLGLRDYKTEPQVWGGDPRPGFCQAEGIPHDWETTYTYWDNRHAAALAVDGKDGLGGKADHRGKVGSTTCRLCGAWRGHLGLEPTPALYVAHLVELGRELARILRPDGTLWLNLGDSYSGSGKGPEGGLKTIRAETRPADRERRLLGAPRNAGRWLPHETTTPKRRLTPTEGSSAGLPRLVPGGTKPKDLLGIPWRVAFAFQEDGWYLRCDVVWAKPNPMPEAVRDRPTHSHEYVFLLTRRPRYYYDSDAVRTPYAASTMRQADLAYDGKPLKDYEGNGVQDPGRVKRQTVASLKNGGGANLKSVWPIPTQPYPGSHFATFPEALVRTCLTASAPLCGVCSKCGAPRIPERDVRQDVLSPVGTPGRKRTGFLTATPKGIGRDTPEGSRYNSVGGFSERPRTIRVPGRILSSRPGCKCGAPTIPALVFDPFAGSGTVLAVARQMGLRSAGVELRPEYAAMAGVRSRQFADLSTWEDPAGAPEPPANHSNLSLRPPLKWAGGKRWLVPEFQKIWGHHSSRRLVEPFCGGLATTLASAPRRALVNDVNPHPINCYRWMQKGLRTSIRLSNDSDTYYAHRERFNELVRTGAEGTQEAAELFYYLNRTCYNGLCRFNRKGEFNVPFGSYAKINYTTDFTPYIRLFRGWEFRSGDFETVKVDPEDLIYADPPYDVDFTQYSKEGFGWADQVRLVEWLRRHAGPVVLSNQATPRVVRLYKEAGFALRYLSAPRMISCDGNRARAREVLALKGVATLARSWDADP
jgi:DNA adenine methylase